MIGVDQSSLGPREEFRWAQQEKHLGEECQLDLKKLEDIATPLTQLAFEWQLLGSLQKC